MASSPLRDRLLSFTPYTIVDGSARPCYGMTYTLVYDDHYRGRSNVEPEAEDTARQGEIEVTVTFPLAEGPYHGAFAGTTTVHAIRTDAMAQFGATEDPQFSYYLTFKGAREDDAATISSIAGKAHAVKFTLVKELIQGGSRR
jgi:hypothetical protein